MARKVVSISMDLDLQRAIDRLAEEMGLNSSQTIRYVMRRATGEEALRAGLIEELSGVQYRLRLNLGKIREGFERVLAAQVTDLVEPYEAVEQIESRSTELPALPARGEDIVEGEIEMEGLGGRRRRRR